MSQLPGTIAEPDRWIVRPGPAADAAVRLFCLSYAGGGASLFRSWPAALPGVDVAPIQLPGHEERMSEPPIADMPPLVTALAAAVCPHLDRPFAVFGHSMGARIAFELTRELRRRDAPLPVRLFVSACKAPHIPRVPTPPVMTLSDRLFTGMLRRMNGTPPEVFDDPELVRAVLPALRADFTLVDTYEYADEPALAVPISVIGGTEDPEAREDDLLAWQAHTTEDFRLRLLAGGHFVVRTRENELTAAVARDLERRPVALPVGPARS